MKVVICINTAWNIANFRLGQMRALRDAGHEMVAMAPPDAYVGVIEQAAFRFVPMPMDNQGSSPVRDFALFLRFWRALRREKPDVFLGYTVKPNVYGSLAAHLLCIPTINNVSGLGTAFITENWLTKVVKQLYRAAFGRSFRVFFQNETDRHHFIDQGLVPAASTDRLPGSGINLDNFAFQTMPDHGDALVFLMVARLLRDKGVYEYLEAAREIKREFPSVRFQIIGEAGVKNLTAISKEEADSWAEEGIVEYLGMVNDVRPNLTGADCMVLPSYREGLSRSLLEAAAIGRPIITTDVPGCREVVDDGINGLLCRVRDAGDLAQKMRTMILMGHEKRAAMGAAGREKVEREFDEKIVIQKYLDVLEEIKAKMKNLK